MQLTKNGIVHLAFHPCTDTLILAAADKSGHIGLWSVDNELAGPSTAASKENQGRGNGQDAGNASDTGHSVIGDNTGQHCLLACLRLLYSYPYPYSYLYSYSLKCIVECFTLL